MPAPRAEMLMRYLGWLVSATVIVALSGSAVADPALDPATEARIKALEERVAQLETLRRAGVRHVVLSAFGCGAFCNPADRVAKLYQRALAETPHGLEDVVFAIFAPGYGPDNYTPFAETFS